jgi:DNA-binding NtrC family response regulator
VNPIKAIEVRYETEVVDDDPDIWEFLPSAMIFFGITVDTARDGVGAVHLQSSNRCDAVVTDADMPGTNGFSLRKLAKERSPGGGICRRRVQGALPRLDPSGS